MPMRQAATADAAARILLIDRDPAGKRGMADNLLGCFVVPPDLVEADGGRQGLDSLRAERFDIVLADLSSLGDLGTPLDETMARMVKLSNGALIVALSDGSSVSAAVAAMRAGAHDYFAKPLTAPAFAARIGELAHRHGKARALTIEPRQSECVADFAGFIGASNQMQFLYEQIERIAPSTAPVFITGESGTGKKICAQALHQRGPRAGQRYVALNCASVGRDQMDRDLFGSRSGAYTGAAEDRAGALEAADGGTLFLDAIGEMDLSLQSKLLRFLQTGMVGRSGETEVRRVDVRVICATDRNPMQLISERKFREDLFYRLHVLPIHLPPLRQRPSDILVLARHFLKRFAQEEHKGFSGFAGDASNLLVGREWPGNVGQLQTLVRRLVVMFEGGEIDAAMLASADIEALDAADAPAGDKTRPAVLPMWQQEQRIIEDAVTSFAGNIALAAAALEISPSTIYRKRQAWAEMEGKQGAA